MGIYNLYIIYDYSSSHPTKTSNKIIKEYFANKIQNNQFIDPITLERISQDQGILLGHHIFQSKTIKTYIMTEDRENLLSLTIPGSVDEQEFIITLLGTHPENPTNRQPLTELDAKLIYHQLYTGTTLPYANILIEKFKLDKL